jgi:hypothetical protein
MDNRLTLFLSEHPIITNNDNGLPQKVLLILIVAAESVVKALTISE